MKREKKQTGITLIALVITVIVLLILAGVTIAALSGDNGILTRAKDAKEKTEQAQKDEEKTLSDMESVLGNVYFDNVNLQDTNPAKAMPSGVTILENDANNGIVIKDKNENEWVWVEVPKTTVFEELAIDTTKELTEQNYNDIKDKLIAYATTYRKGSALQDFNWTDEWYEGCGLTPEEYATIYQKMLKSIYNYGGFWIGRYEAGIEGSIEDVSKARISHTDIEIGVSPKAVSQKDTIPYNWIYCGEAQSLAEEMVPDSDYTSSLMFGIQWDLVCKFLEMKGGLTTADVNFNSSSWGIFNSTERLITSKKAKKSGTPWSVVAEVENINGIWLTAGASDDTKKMNIYDFAGNIWEWTLERAIGYDSSPCVCRGGSYYYSGYDSPASYRSFNGVTANIYLIRIGFRSTFFN